ncbi:MAG: ribosome assembly RNA-binding protein YhbY [Clostridia bacterium]|nr:ribosome assembly RNA-binding protein YhbY [Clostridia bacterium]
MFTSKQRSNLRSLAQTIEPIGQVGKGGISDNMITSFSQALDSRELIKITVLNNSDEEARFVADDLAAALNAEVVCTIGHKVVLYRKSDKKGVKHIEF